MQYSAMPLNLKLYSGVLDFAKVSSTHVCQNKHGCVFKQYDCFFFVMLSDILVL